MIFFYCFFNQVFQSFSLHMERYHPALTPLKGSICYPAAGNVVSRQPPHCQVLHGLHSLLRAALNNAPLFPEQHTSRIKAWQFLPNSGNCGQSLLQSFLLRWLRMVRPSQFGFSLCPVLFPPSSLHRY